MEGIKIFEQQLSEKCKLAILVGGVHSDNPMTTMNNVVSKYVGKKPHNYSRYFHGIEISLDNPWTRIVIGDIGNLPFEEFDSFLRKRERREKLKQINEISR